MEIGFRQELVTDEIWAKMYVPDLFFPFHDGEESRFEKGRGGEDGFVGEVDIVLHSRVAVVIADSDGPLLHAAPVQVQVAGVLR